MDPSFAPNASLSSPHSDHQLTLNTSVHGSPVVDYVSLVAKEGEANSQRGSQGSESSMRSNTVSDEEDYDLLQTDPTTVLRGSHGGGLQSEPTLERPHKVSLSVGMDLSNQSAEDLKLPPLIHLEGSQPSSFMLQETGEDGNYILKANDPELREILRKGLQREAEAKSSKRMRTRFRDLVFTRQFTAFDRQNTATSPFRGFFTLFWLATFLMLVKIAASNWKSYGSVFGRNEILTMMFHRDVLVLGLTDGIMCASTVFCLILQKAILADYLSWNKHGWLIQNVWQALYLVSTISWTIYREWGWSHTVFLVLHSLAMLMKQHSYAFYNGYLSETLRQRKTLKRKLAQLKQVNAANSVISSSSPIPLATSYLDQNDMNTIHRRRASIHSKTASRVVQEQESDLANVAAAIDAEAPLDFHQIRSFERIIKAEIEGLDEELRGKCSSDSKISYPHNLTLRDFAGYIPLPTLVYELEYPRQDQINWFYVAEKTAATFGVLGVMIVVSQAYIYPAVIYCLDMKEQGMPLSQRLQEFPWVLSDLLFPFMMEYLLAWYVIWECILNVLAELTMFADRGFYADWWNSTSWDQFARDWNRPVHNFLLRHVYHSSISSFQISRSSATTITFLLSACVHELVMWCIFKKLRGYLMGAQLLQLPLMEVSRRYMKGQDVLGNIIFWVGLFTGPSFLCSLYLII